MVANINVCPVRESDFLFLGADAVADKVLGYVRKDLAHAHEHARWLQRALEWERLGRPKFALPRSGDLRDFSLWLENAVRGRRRGGRSGFSR